MLTLQSRSDKFASYIITFNGSLWFSSVLVVIVELNCRAVASIPKAFFKNFVKHVIIVQMSDSLMKHTDPTQAAKPDLKLN